MASACVVVAIAAGAWIVVDLAGGGKGWALAVVAAAAFAAILVGAWRSRSDALEAARRVEQVAGWQERLSTAVELEAAGSDNIFRERLAAEVEALLRQNSPAALIPWGLQRPAVVAGTLLVAAATVGAIWPLGLFVREDAGLSPERRRAADALQDAIARAESAPAKFSDLRAELVGLLDKVRSDRPLDDVRGETDRMIAEVDRRAAKQLRDDAKRAATDLGKSPRLVPLGEALAKLDGARIEKAGGDLARQLAAMPDAERQGMADSLDAGAGASESPGVSESLKSMARAARNRDATQFAKCAVALASAVETEAGGESSPAFGPLRQALLDAKAALGGASGSPRRGDFFVESKGVPDNTTGTGNLGVRSKPQNIKSVWQGAKAVDASLPQLTDIIRDAHAAAESGHVAPAYREYVKRYFATDNQ